MSVQNRDDTGIKNCNETGIDRSPVNQPFHRQTLGIPALREKSPEQLVREQAQAFAQQGNWDINKLRERMKERGIQLENPSSNIQQFESKRRISPIDPKTKMLNLGKSLLEKSMFNQPPEEFSVDCITEDLDALLKPAGLQNIWRSFINLSGMQQRILNKHYEMGLTYPEDGVVSFLPEELQNAIIRFQRNLVAILAFLNSQKTPKCVCEDIQNSPAPISEEGEKIMSSQKPTDKKRIYRGGMSKKFSSSTNTILKQIGIEHINDLTGLKSYELVAKLARKKHSSKTIRAIASNMLKHKLSFADGEEATRGLMIYDPKTYKPPVEMPASVLLIQTPPREAGAGPPATQSAVSKTSPDIPAREKSLRATLKRFSAAFDFLTVNGGSPEKIEGYEENFMAENGQEYLLSISIKRKNPPA